MENLFNQEKLERLLTVKEAIDFIHYLTNDTRTKDYSIEIKNAHKEITDKMVYVTITLQSFTKENHIIKLVYINNYAIDYSCSNIRLDTFK